MLAAIDDMGDLAWHTVWGPGLDNLVEFIDESGNRHAIMTDERRHVVGTWDLGDDVVDDLFTYNEYGRVTVLAPDYGVECTETGLTACQPAKTLDLPFFHSSAWRSDITGVVNLRHRWYHPALGQFLTHDPLGYVDSYSLYSYVGMDPINGWDPFGLRNRSLAGEDPSLLQNVEENWRDLTDPLAKMFGPVLWFLRIAESGYGPHKSAEYQGFAEEGGRDLIDEIALGVATGSAGNVATKAGKIVRRVNARLKGRKKRPNSESEPATGDVAWCFPPGTLVLMADGTALPIEDIEVGDYVMSLFPDGDDYGVPNRVEAVISNKTRELWRVHLIDDEAQPTSLSATGEHPFYTGRGWVSVADLRPGDLLLTSERKTLEVETTVALEVTSPTYNLSVARPNTYFVFAGNDAVLVHNQDPPRIHGVADDWGVKGAHVTAHGIELSITGGGGRGGSTIRIEPVFRRDRSNPNLRRAIASVRRALADPVWRAQLLQRTRSATKHLGKHKDPSHRAGSGKTRALEVTLERWCD